MKVAVLGAGGFLGRALVAELVAQGMGVHALARDWRGVELTTEGESVTCFEGDVADPEVSRTVMRGCSVAYHMAYHGIPLRDGVDHLVEYDTNLRMLSSVMSGAEYGGVERLVLLSSGGTIYGETDLPANEDSALRPISHYGAIKQLSEAMLAQYCRLSGTLDYAVARVANPFGPGQLDAKRRGLVVSAMLRAVTGEPVQVHDEGRQVRDYLFVDDAVRALVLLGMSPAASGLTVNIGSGRGRSVDEVLRDVEQVTGQHLERRQVPGRTQDVERSLLDVTRLQELVGEVEVVGYREGLRRTWEAVTSRQSGLANLT